MSIKRACGVQKDGNMTYLDETGMNKKIAPSNLSVPVPKAYTDAIGNKDQFTFMGPIYERGDPQGMAAHYHRRK